MTPGGTHGTGMWPLCLQTDITMAAEEKEQHRLLLLRRRSRCSRSAPSSPRQSSLGEGRVGRCYQDGGIKR